MTQSRAWVGDVLRSALLPHCPYSYGEKRPGVPRVLLCKAEMQLKIYQESDPGTNPSSLLYLWRSSLAKWLWWLTLSETVRRDKRDSVHCSEFSLEIQTWADIWALCCLEQGVDRGTWALWVPITWLPAEMASETLGGSAATMTQRKELLGRERVAQASEPRDLSTCPCSAWGICCLHLHPLLQRSLWLERVQSTGCREAEMPPPLLSLWVLMGILGPQWKNTWFLHHEETSHVFSVYKGLL
jgi:hypothetical protein